MKSHATVAQPLACILVSLFLGSALFAQTQSVPENGTGNPDTQDEGNNDKPSGEGEGTEGDPVEVSTGAFVYSQPLFTLPGREEPLSLTLSYVSNARGIETQTGARWTHDFEERLMIQYTWLGPIEPYPGPSDVGGWAHIPHSFGPQAQGWQPPPRPLAIDVYHFHDLRVDYYQMKPGDSTTWLPMSGQATKLRSQNVQSGPYNLPASFVIRYPDGSKTYFPNALWEGGCGIYTIRAGISQDAKGNTVTRSYDTVPITRYCPGDEGTFYRRLREVTDNYGRKLSFAYDTTGWLHEITDAVGRKATLGHDSIGNIVSIERPSVLTLAPFPGVGAYTPRIEIEYMPPGVPKIQHNIHQIFAANEVQLGGAYRVPYVVNNWDTGGDRVTSQIVGGTNYSGVPAGGKYVFLQEDAPLWYDWFECARRTLVVSPDGVAALHLFDWSLRPRLVFEFTGYLDPNTVDGLSINELVWANPASPSASDSLNPGYALPPAGSTGVALGCRWKRFDYAANGLVSLELTQDSRTEYTYDVGSPDLFQLGNLLLISRVANDGSGVTLRQAFAYEPLYNQSRREYDPRAFDGYLPQNGGAPSPERYSVTHYFDYQESSQAALQGELAYWSIDVNQQSAVQALAAHGLTLDPISFGSDLNGNGVADGIGGNVVRTVRAVNVYTDPLTPTSFQTLSESLTHEYNTFGLLTRTTDAAGFQTQYLYYESGTAPHNPLVAPSSATEGGCLAKIVSFADLAATQPIVTQFGYDSLGRTDLVVDPRGSEWYTTYDELDRVVETMAAVGTISGFYYDPNGNIIREFLQYWKPKMNLTTGEPNGGYSIPRNIVTRLFYDIMDNVVTREVQNDAQGGKSTVKYRYTKAGTRVLTLYPEWVGGSGNVSASFFDEFGREWATTTGGITLQFATHPCTSAIAERASIPVDVPNVTATTRCFYSGARLSRRADALGHSTSYDYDAFNRSTKTTDPLGNYTRVELDVSGRPILTERHDVGTGTDVTLSRTRSFYDERGHLFKEQRDHFNAAGAPIGDGSSTTRACADVRGFVTSVVNDNGHAWRHEYDGLGRRIRRDDPEHNFTIYKYDKNDNLIFLEDHQVATDDPSAIHVQRTWLFHDAANRVIATADELGQASRFLYDAAGRLTFKSDARAATIDVPLSSLDDGVYPQHEDLSDGPVVNRHGNTTWYQYDDQGYLLQTTQHQRVAGLGGNALLNGASGAIVTSITYDLNGRRHSESDDVGHATTYSYDDSNRLVHTMYADQTSMIREYYLTGDLRQTLDANETRVDFLYDAAGRQIRETVTPGPQVRGGVYADFGYDGANRLTSAQNAAGTVTREYDSLSRLTAEVLNGRRTEIRIDAVGNPTEYAYPGGRHVFVSMDAIGRLRQLADPGNPVPIARWEYHSQISEKSQVFANGVTATTLYDAMWQPTAKTVRLGTTVLDNRTFAWDRQGNRVTRTDLRFANPRVYSYAYDSVARLVQSQRTGSALPAQTVTYTLDDVGNRTAVTGGAYPGQYTMSGADAPVNAYTTTPFDSRAYDDNGNLQSAANGLTLYYDYRGRLVETNNTVSGRRHLYFYDALGRRIRKTTDVGVAAEKTIDYFFDGGVRICEERNNTGLVTATYVNGRGIDDVVSMRRDVDGDTISEDYYYHADDLGNVWALTNATGGVVERYEYRDYGQVVHPQTTQPLLASAIHNSRLFTGREMDWESGLYYYRNRYYDPYAGRFISRDPLGVWGDIAHTGNAYTYAGSNPWTIVDPMGLEGEDAQGEDVKGDCENSRTDPDGLKIKGDTEHHGSVSGKEDKSGIRISTANYQRRRLAEKQMAAWQAKIDRIKELKDQIEDDPNYDGEPHDIDVDIDRDGRIEVTVKDKTQKADPRNKSDMDAIGEAIDAALGHNEGIIINRDIKMTIFVMGAFMAADEVAGVVGKLFGRGAGGAAKGTGKLKKAGQAPDRGGLSKAGRALEKHGSRPGSVFPRATGNVTAKNAQGQAVLDDILDNVRKTSPNKLGGSDYFGGSTGGGARFDSGGNFIGFLEP